MKVWLCETNRNCPILFPLCMHHGKTSPKVHERKDLVDWTLAWRVYIVLTKA